MSEDSAIDRVAEIERLAALDPINYEGVRADAANEIECPRLCVGS